MKVIKTIKSMSFEERCVFTVKFSIAFNCILGLGKFGLAAVNGDVFFFVAGIINVLLLFAKLNCYSGIKINDNADSSKNTSIAILLLLAGLQYIIYMARLLFKDNPLNDYGPIISVIIAAVAFTELGIAVFGCFKAVGKGYYFKNVKLINFCSALTAIVLTEVALMTFAGANDGFNTAIISGIFGIVVGCIIVFIAVYIFIQPKISILGKEKNVYKYINGDFKQEKINIKLTNSKFYSNYYYEGIINNNICEGLIIKGKNPIKSWNIWILITVIILSEILIFPYALGALITHFKDYKILKILDDNMKELGFERMDIE